MKNMFWLARLLPVVMILIFSVSCNKDKNARCMEKNIEDCICLAHWDPVCGCNGKTYSNKGCASCAGIDDYTMGECE